ncbi:uncharacterized protein LOC123535189 [Mercenaria mercenaria]|uniref:uncharacterized protein LOC123535189 n=1 Tax=Mercenaria mercenaria TaxID=6596 RepID=UPI00234F5C94|nr:uncharacterized protein LOC123535189 [Mercenaria mercenaria]
MADGDPPVKKQKLEIKDKNLHLFERCKKHKDTLCIALKELETWNLFGFCFVRLEQCNAAFSCCFTQAWCATLRHVEDEDVDEKNKKLVYFGSVLDVDVLKNFLNNQSKISKEQAKALEKLADSLDNIQEINKVLKEELENSDQSEVRWAVVCASHLLTSLAITNQMTVSDTGSPARFHQCPCASGCKKPIRVGDTSIGHKDVWHGSVDILLGPVAIVTSPEQELFAEGISTFELKMGNLEVGRHQLIAETIVFSHAQNSLGYKLGLVPTIALSKDRVKVFMYDPNKDLLYESVELPLFDDRNLSVSTVVALWLAINYIHFEAHVPASHTEFGYTANFRKALHDDKKMEIYRNKIRIGGCKQPSRTKPNLMGFSYGKLGWLDVKRKDDEVK